MIAGIFHTGSGLGNQLHRYVAARVLALDKGYEFGGMVAPESFKGKNFMNLDMATKFNPPTFNLYPSGKTVVDTGADYSGISQYPLWEEWNKFCYDPDINFVADNTIVDGSFEDPRYFEHRLDEIREWLKVEPIEMPDDLCVIGFRGGEYYTVPELGLPRAYYAIGIEEMQKINPAMRFEVHTDDPILAQQFFPDLKIIHNIGINWRSMRYAKYAIIANSSFYVLPRLLNGGLTVAPRWWNRYNTKKWDYPQNYYKQFHYV